MNEERILDKLEDIDQRGVQTLLTVTRLEEQIKDVPDLKARVTSLERLRWLAMGALAASGTSLATQLLTVVKGA